MRYLRTSLVAVAIAGLQSAPLLAQQAPQPSLEQRVGRVEQEMRAVQRKVFPDGAGKYLQPEMSAPAPAATDEGSPASSPVADLNARVSAIEGQLRTLTDQSERNNFRVQQLEKQFADFKAANSPPPVDAGTGDGMTPAGPSSKPVTKPGAKPLAADSGKPVANNAAAVTLSGSADRKVAVAAIERPSTGNAADDSFAYGFRLWTAKFYPEAQVQLKATVDKYGTTSVGSRAQNLLGRAYLDDGKPALASVAFYENYQKRPDSDRAPDSLTYLGEALIQLKKLPDACKVYQELNDHYGTNIRAELKALVEKGKARAKCSA